MWSHDGLHIYQIIKIRVILAILKKYKINICDLDSHEQIVISPWMVPVINSLGAGPELVGCQERERKTD